MTSTMKSPALPAGALDAGRRAAIIAGLNASLANLIDLAAAAKQAHWNVRGANFSVLHELFDAITNEVRSYADLCAERAVTFGGSAHGTIQDVSAGSELPPFPTDVQGWETLVRALRERMHATAERMRKEIRSLDDEPVTQDLYIGMVKGLEMRTWMLDAHLS